MDVIIITGTTNGLGEQLLKTLIFLLYLVLEKNAVIQNIIIIKLLIYLI